MRRRFKAYPAGDESEDFVFLEEKPRKPITPRDEALVLELFRGDRSLDE